MDAADILHYIELSGGISPKWIPKATTKSSISQSSKDEIYIKILFIGIGIVALIALAILIYRSNRSAERLNEAVSNFKKEQERKSQQKETELEPEENGRK